MCFLFHKWGKWEDTQKGDIIPNEGSPLYIVRGLDSEKIDPTPIGRYIRQERRCSDCNKVELRTESNMI